MAVYEVFAHPELRRYKTTIWSKASILMLVILIFTFIAPLLVVYRSYGFWLKEAYYREYPTVRFAHELMVIAELEGAGSYVTYSTYQQYNRLQQDRLRSPVITSREVDENGDGRKDKLIFNLELPLMDTENVHGVKLLLFFDYRLRKFSSFYTQSLAYMEHESPKAGAMLEVFADLRFQQKQPLLHRGIDSRYNTSVVNYTNPFAETYQLSTIFRNYNARNATTELQNLYKVWTSGRAANTPFKIAATINYPEDVFLYTPGFWYLIKWGWVQYAAVLFLFLIVFHRIKIFIFENQLVTTIVDRPFVEKKVI